MPESGLSRAVVLTALMSVMAAMIAVPVRAAPAAGAAIWSDVAAGSYHTCAIRDDRSAWCWGSNDDGELGDGTTVGRTRPVRVDGGGAWASVSPGYDHTCGIRTDGTLWCWGGNSSGQLGTGAEGSGHTTPARVGTGTTWVSVHAGDTHTCAIRADGGLWCWGGNVNGQLGDGTMQNRPAPVRVGTGADWTAVTAGEITCGLRTGGALWCWGKVTQNGNRPSPARVGATSWRSVSGSFSHVCAVDAGGALWCWGKYPGGSVVPVPFRIGTAASWSTVSAGDGHDCALTAGGAMSCWGGNYYGELGDGTRSDASGPTPVNTDLTWTKIAAGRDHTCALTTTGGLWCWGYNNGGQLGDGTTGDATYSLTALRVGGDTPWSSVDAGEKHTCALRTDDTLWCWGDDSDGALGDGPGVTRAGPVPVAGGGTWRTFDAGGSDTCGIRSDSTLWCWGENLGGSRRAFTPHRIGDAAGWAGVSVDGGHACAVRTDATLWCWGVFVGSIVDTTDAASDEPVRARTDLRERWAEVATGNDHACALSIERRLWCWGGNAYGQLGTTRPDSPVRLSDGATTATPALIRSEANTTCAIDTEKGLWCWGENAHGRPADGSPPTGTGTTARIGDAKDWLAVSANYYHVCGVRAGGSLWCWGAGGNGQLGDGGLTNRTEPAEVTAGGPWLSVSAGAAHTCALRTDHRLWCWGNSDHQQLGHPVPVRHPVAVPST
ncbi:hypothetical protein Aph02nite_28820 [Actinoplanes philippinensis]|uniref:Alpha-tubulin suppressor n=1 Tax=Actinoplanes philippinensis TaxID=35752 RepID=A0A1I2EJV9_9ACTN|nr:RCC1 domain-containing protein [Actinoplanes philippinensis]GIE76932.1 hypothetical protein Aph02nite_28820 [Actinoplanes philippinensis]SFE93145.1 Alpha-tubulin suppressor [Actinoplanes philippinensis]